MVDVRYLEALLQTYTLLDILEHNDLTEADALHFLIEQEFITLPAVRPV